MRAKIQDPQDPCILDSVDPGPGILSGYWHIMSVPHRLIYCLRIAADTSQPTSIVDSTETLNTVPPEEEQSALSRSLSVVSEPGK